MTPREALERYGVHSTGCRVWFTGAPTDGATDQRCTCGLRNAALGFDEEASDPAWRTDAEGYVTEPLVNEGAK